MSIVTTVQPAVALVTALAVQAPGAALHTSVGTVATSLASAQPQAVTLVNPGTPGPAGRQGPAGEGVAGIALLAAEALLARDLVHVSVAGLRRASAGSSRFADGFVNAAFAAGATATYWPSGQLSGLSGLTAGATLYLSTAAGSMTMTPSNTNGHLLQPVGRALSESTALVLPGAAFELAGLGA